MKNQVLNRPMFRKPLVKAEGTGITAYFFGGGEFDYQELLKQYLEQPSPKMPEAPITDYDTLYKKYKDVVSAGLGPERSFEQIMQERMKVLGPPTDMESARNYALMQLGSRIASTPGGLAQGIAAGMPEYGAILNKAETEGRAAQRAVAASSLDTLEKERAARRSAESEARGYAFKESEAAKAAAYKSAVEAALKTEERKFKAVEEGAKQQAQIKKDYGVLGTETFALPDDNAPGGFKIVGARRTPSGLVQVGNNEPLPATAIPVGDQFVSNIYTRDQAKEAVNISIKKDDGTFSKPYAAIQKGNKFYFADTGEIVTAPFRLVDKAGTTGSGTSASYVIQDPDSPFGLREVIGFTDPMTNQNYFMQNGVRFDFDSNKGIKASLADVLRSETQNGETTTTPSYGPYAGKPFTVSSEKRNVQFKPPVPNKDPALLGGEVKPQEGEAQKKGEKAPIGAITGQGAERYFIKPEPFTSSLNYSQFSTQDKQDLRDSIQNGEAFLATADDVLKAMPEGLGPLNRVKSLSTNYIAPIVPETLAPYVSYLKQGAAKQQLRLMQKTVRQAFALNPRFPQGELATIDEMIEDPDKFFVNPQEGMTRFATLIRDVRNTLERSRAAMEGRDAKVIERVPTGSANDPFSFDKTPYLVELKNSGVNLKGVYYRDAEGNLRQIP